MRRALPATPPAAAPGAAPGAVLAPALVPAAAMVAAAAGVPAVAVAALVGAPVAALAAAPPVRAAPASASRVPAALPDRHLERGPAPSCRAFRRRAPRADGNDLRAPGDDSQPGPPPTTRWQTCIDALCAYLRIPDEPDPGDRSTPAGRHTGANRTGVLILPWTCGGPPGGVTRRSARTATSGPGRVIVSWMPCECAPAPAAPTRGPGHLVVYCQAYCCLAAWYSLRHEPTDSA
jgi:hypothetical protein